MNLNYFILFICDVFVYSLIIKRLIEILTDKDYSKACRLSAGLGIAVMIIIAIVIIAYCISQAL